MKTQKIAVVINVEALSINTIPSMVREVATQIEREFVGGRLEAEDGDTAEWQTDFEKVAF